MNIHLSTVTLLVSGFVVLSACSSEPVNSPPQPDLVLEGTALQLQNAGAPYSPTPVGATAMVALSGSVADGSNETAISDGTYLLVDADGFDENGVLTDGTVYAVALDGPEGETFTGSYEYVVPVAYTYQNGSSTNSVLGNIGIMAAAADMPIAGTAQYTGDAYARVESSDAQTEFLLYGGLSIIDVDFAAGTVDVTMGLFASVDLYAPTVIAPIDTISGTGMSIIGASFAGGTWVTLKNGVVVNFTGPSTTGAASGDFYGYNPVTAAPDEIGGVILMEGDSGLVYGIYTANLMTP